MHGSPPAWTLLLNRTPGKPAAVCPSPLACSTGTSDPAPHDQTDHSLFQCLRSLGVAYVHESSGPSATQSLSQKTWASPVPTSEPQTQPLLRACEFCMFSISFGSAFPFPSVMLRSWLMILISFLDYHYKNFPKVSLLPVVSFSIHSYNHLWKMQISPD